jgi:hypothetical protein
VPISDVIATQEGATIRSDGNAPKAMNAPTGEVEPTTMNTPDGLAPYIHNQTLADRSALALMGTVLVLIRILEKFV